MRPPPTSPSVLLRTHWQPSLNLPFPTPSQHMGGHQSRETNTDCAVSFNYINLPIPSNYRDVHWLRSPPYIHRAPKKIPNSIYASRAKDLKIVEGRLTWKWDAETIRKREFRENKDNVGRIKDFLKLTIVLREWSVDGGSINQEPDVRKGKSREQKTF